MPRLRMTPWQDTAELLEVRDKLYPEDKVSREDRLWAIEVVTAWSVRGGVPHLVSSTAALTAAILNDTGDNIPYCAEFAYAGAICLFVTGLVDPGRKGIYVKSMYDVAEEIGLRASFVDVRHDATHGPLPSLVVLRQAAQDALKECWTRYWQQFSLEEDKLRVRLRELLRQYIRLHMGGRRDLALLEVNALLRGLASHIPNRREADILSGILAEAAITNPDDRELGSSIDGSVAVFEYLMQVLGRHTRHFLPALMDEHIRLLTMPSPPSQPPALDARREAAFLWLVRLLTHEAWRPHGRYHGLDPDAVVAKCLGQPGTWTLRLATSMTTSIPPAASPKIWNDVIAMAHSGAVDIVSDTVSDDEGLPERIGSPLPVQ
ncbi:MAG: rRNA-processing protein las1 [Thelocarpon superellum]|nr:MAG: rRNA-processing protein las1 [Thelocarpon superellum]